METLTRMFRSRLAWVAVAVLLLVAVAAIFAPLIGPQSPFTQTPNLLAGPSWHHLLGTDNLGRDTLSRLILGTRYSILGALQAVGIGVAGGVVPGVYFVFAPRWLDFLAMRVVDALMTIPGIVLALGFIAAFGETQTVAMAAIGILMIPHFFRITRAATVRLVETEYVQVAVSMGATRFQVIRTHIWRKVLPTVGVTMASSMGAGLLAVSSLAFLGVGVKAPAPSWGGMLSQDLGYLSSIGWLVVFPGLAVVLPVASLGILADRLRDSTGGSSLGMRSREPALGRQSLPEPTGALMEPAA